MAEEPPKIVAGSSGAGPRAVGQLDRSLWRRLAEADTAGEFGRCWLGLQSRMIEGVAAGALQLAAPGSDRLATVAVWPDGAGDASARLATVLDRAGVEGKGVVIRSEAGGDGAADGEPPLHLAYPVLGGNVLQGVAALEIAPRPQSQLQTAMRQLQWGVAWVQNWALRRASAPEGPSGDRLGAVLELTAMILEKGRFKGAATAFVTELASRLRCDRVSLGFLRGKHVKVHALSHSAQFGKQMNLLRSIGMAMMESIDQNAPLLWPEVAGSRQVLQAHEQLARAHGDRAICTVPFLDPDERAFGALTLERSVDEPFDDNTLALCDSLGALAGPILDEKRRNDRNVLAKVGQSFWDQVKKLIGPRYALRKLLAAVFVALVLFLVFAEGTYRVAAKTTLEGRVQRVVTSPFRGFIAEAPARSGDVVSEGALLCRLDERDLRVEYSRWSSEREQHLLEHRRAMAEGDLAAMNVLDKKMQQAEAQIELLNEQIERTTIKAPFDGLVVSGDLSQALGAPVEQGEVLFEVAPLDAYRVMLQVDERDIRDVRVGQTGELVLTSMPNDKHRLRVEKITPVSISEEGRNYYLVEASLDETSERLRPGMEGFGKIEIDERKLVWIWTHGLIDWARLWLWSWLP